ncbi:nuclease-related domain-containing protein [Halomonas sp. JS92-SW72]|uniref:nuclease-related domain-containing protein n=1 Tax=Halomonas sp. JS92-SW72 TaxID=2306583 RepID=UPI000E5B74B1|nr:nuclease-related domain-containing protein [Halomonas sp. JS92-SW72]AXY43845.1 NERD domain-containing protein [Halomonas sp. JS92-SW72]
MILKEKDAYSGTDERGYYGHKQEQDVAFHLRREFGDSEQVRIIHDLVIEHGGERAQIDHLVIHPYGFIIIESKSIVGEVQVNAEGEWSRSYKGNWSGMPSPIRQAELQQDLLKTLLRDHVGQLLGKLLGIQTQIGGREWRTLCAISSTAILHRKKMPKDVADKVVKTEFVAKKAKELIGSLRGGLLKGRPWFSMQELENIGTFLLTHTATVQTEPEKPAEVTALNEPIPSAAPVSEPAPRSYVVTDAERLAAESPADTAVPTEKLLTCKQCGEADNLVGMYGQYGYYVRCASCNTNTSMKQPSCPACGWKAVRVSKDGPSYTATCRKCDHQYLVYRQVEGST